MDGEFRLEPTCLSSDAPFSARRTAPRYCWTRVSASSYGMCDGREGRACQEQNKGGVIVVGDRAIWWDNVRDILFKGMCQSFLRQRYRKVSGSCRGTDTSSLHKIAVWSDVGQWCNLVERRMLSLCLESTKSSRWPWLWVGSVTDLVRLKMSMMSCSFLECSSSGQKRFSYRTTLDI